MKTENSDNVYCRTIAIDLLAIKELHKTYETKDVIDQTWTEKQTKQ